MSDKTQKNDKEEENLEKNKEGDSKAVETVKGILEDADINEDVREEVVGKVKSLEVQRGKKAEKLTEYEKLGSLEELQEQLEEDVEDKDRPETEDDDEDFSERFEKEWRKRKLKEKPYPDELKEEIEEWADFKGISIEEAEEADHIASKIDDWERENKVKNASISRRGKGKGGGSPKTPEGETPNFDMSTEEGRKAWEKHKEEMKGDL